MSMKTQPEQQHSPAWRTGSGLVCDERYTDRIPEEPPIVIGRNELSVRAKINPENMLKANSTIAIKI